MDEMPRGPLMLEAFYQRVLAALCLACRPARANQLTCGPLKLEIAVTHSEPFFCEIIEVTPM